MDEQILDKILEINEEFFKTNNDPTQISSSRENFYKLQKLSPKTFVYKLNQGVPISWVFIIPTSKDLMNKFLDKQINERELLDLTTPQNLYESVYLCAAFTLPEYRRKGYIVEMFKEAIEGIPLIQNFQLFAWSFSKEGEKIIEKLEFIFGKKILLKK